MEVGGWEGGSGMLMRNDWHALPPPNLKSWANTGILECWCLYLSSISSGFGLSRAFRGLGLNRWFSQRSN